MPGRRRRRLPPPPPPNTPTHFTKPVKQRTVHLTSGQQIRQQQPQEMPAANPPTPNGSFPNIPADKARSDHYVLKACASAVDELTTLKSTVNTLRMDYLALEEELRQRMDQYVAAREEAKKWKERCIAMEECEDGIYTSRGLRAQNDRFVQRHGVQEKMGEVWRKRDSFVWLREDEEKQGGLGRAQVKHGVERVTRELVGCKKKLHQRWCDWKQKRKE